MPRKKKPNPLNLFQRSQLFRDTFEKWKDGNLNPEEPNHAEPTIEPDESNHPGNQNMVQEEGNQFEGSAEPMSEPPESPDKLSDDDIATQVTIEDLAEVIEEVQEQQTITKELTEELEGTKRRIVELENKIEELRAVPVIHEHLVRQSAWTKMAEYREGKEATP